MISGRHLREAREMLGWGRDKLARRAKVSYAMVMRAETSPDEPMVTIVQANALIHALRAGGIDFVTGSSTGGAVTMGLRTQADESQNG